MSARDVAVVFADSHLQERTWRHRPIYGDSYHSFRQLVNFAVDRKLPLIGAGDLLDSKLNSSEPIIFLHEELDRLSRAGFKIFHIVGQHDGLDSPWLSLGETAVHGHKKLCELEPFSIYGLDFQPADRFREEISQVPKSADVVVCHQTFSRWMGSVTLPQGDFEHVPHASLLLTGDFHETRQETAVGASGQKLDVFSPGSTCMQKIDEPVEKFFGVLDDEGQIRLEPLRTRRMVDWTPLVCEDDLENLLESLPVELDEAAQYAEERRLPVELRTPLVRVTYSHKLRDVIPRVTKLAGGRAHLFWKELPKKSQIKSPTSQIVAGQQNQKALTLASCLADEVDPETQPGVFRLAQRLLESEDLKQELAAWRKEVLHG